ncbi:MAG: deoxyribodipyrimidine photo-lyase, partial [Actinocatenispora sp.]
MTGTAPDRMRTAIVLFTRDLRVHDNPALHAACREAERVVPLFVLDPGIGPFAVPHRLRFLHDCLTDLREQLRRRGGDLVIRRGDTVTQLLRLARGCDADGVVLAAEYSGYGQRREQALARECDRHRLALRTVTSLTVVPPGEVVPAGGGHYKVFTPYWRAWSAREWRAEVAAPRRVRLPDGVDVGELPDRDEMTGGPVTADLPAGGETAARRRMTAWLRHGIAGYQEHHDDLAGDRTSRLSADLHFGCLSPLELATRSGRADGGEPYVRQLCWRDFHAQVTAAFPAMPRRDY